MKCKPMRYRKLSEEEIRQLQARMCMSTDWSSIEVADGFSTEHIRQVRFYGGVRLGRFDKEFELAGGIRKHSGIFNATLHNVTVGDNCCIENVNNYIANYEIGNDTFIENVDIILCDGESTFGNGVDVAVMSESGGREVRIFDYLSSQVAYMMAFYRHNTALVEALQEYIDAYVRTVSSSVGRIGEHVVIADAGYLKNVRVGDWCKIEGASRLKNGSINSNAAAPVHVGVGVIGDDFIISSGAEVEDGVTFSRVFIGQACKLGHTYSATDSLIFSNSQGENGEACSIFAGPFTVTHHKSTLLIAGMFSFMNAGSGSNQSNHMYKLGPIHQGIMERGAKTASDSYILWPAKVGAFSLVMGRHVSHQDTSDLPFSYLIEDQSTSFIIPGANLKSVGTIRDAKKWPLRDQRKDPLRLDMVNYNLLSPYTIQKMLNGMEILRNLERVSGENSEMYTYQSGKIKRSSLRNGLRLYGLAVDKFLGNSLISRIQQVLKVNGLVFSDEGDETQDLLTFISKAVRVLSADQLIAGLRPETEDGLGRWLDLSGLIAPKPVIHAFNKEIVRREFASIQDINARLREIHARYYDYEWTWAYRTMGDYYGLDLDNLKVADLIDLVKRWKDSVITLDKLVYEDARKEFSLSAMTSFGIDGDEDVRNRDFMQVRGSGFEADPFVTTVRNHIEQKTALGNRILAFLNALC